MVHSCFPIIGDLRIWVVFVITILYDYQNKIKR